MDSTRLKTEELLPCFRQSFQIHTMNQDLSHLQTSIEMKDKQIFYLSSQITSLKEEHLQKVMQLQTIINNNKKQINDLRYLTLKSKRLESERGDKALEKQKELYHQQLQCQKQTYEEIIERITKQFQLQIQLLQEKNTSVLDLQKKQQNSLKNLLQERKSNYQAILSQLKEEIENSRSQNKQLQEDLHKYNEAIDAMKEDFRAYGEKMQNREKQYKLEIQKLKSQLLISKQQVISVEKQLKKTASNLQKQQNQHEEDILNFRNQIEKLKFLILQKDQELAKINQSENLMSRFTPLNPIRQCNHNGLIQQLERNVHLKEKQNQDLLAKLKHWSKYIGFQKSLEDKEGQLETKAENAMKQHAALVKYLRKKSTK